MTKGVGKVAVLGIWGCAGGDGVPGLIVGGQAAASCAGCNQRPTSSP
jgi:hypothetical protein